jgi:hypothetical protein
VGPGAAHEAAVKSRCLRSNGTARAVEGEPLLPRRDDARFPFAQRPVMLPAQQHKVVPIGASRTTW